MNISIPPKEKSLSNKKNSETKEKNKNDTVDFWKYLNNLTYMKLAMKKTSIEMKRKKPPKKIKMLGELTDALNYFENIELVVGKEKLLLRYLKK